jgi:hypothetical protein
MNKNLRKLSSAAIFMIVLLALSSCKSGTDKAITYYDQLMDYQQAVLDKEDVLIQGINVFIPDTSAEDSTVSPSHDSLSPQDDLMLRAAYTDFKTQIGSSLNEVKAMDDFDGNADLKNAATALLEAYERLCNKEYSEIVEIAISRKATTDSTEMTRFLGLTATIDSTLGQLITEYTSACRIFAKEYNFEIDAAETEDKQPQ